VEWCGVGQELELGPKVTKGEELEVGIVQG